MIKAAAMRWATRLARKRSRDCDGSHHLGQQLADRSVVGRPGFPDLGELGEREERRLVAGVDDGAGTDFEQETGHKRPEHAHKVAPVLRGDQDLKKETTSFSNDLWRICADKTC